MTIWIHIIAAVILFFLVNWLGGRLTMRGYVPLTILPDLVMREQDPTADAGFRVLAPLAYQIVVAAAFLEVSRPDLVDGIYWIAVYYFGLRWLARIVMGRTRLVNWRREVLYASISIALCWWVYDGWIAHSDDLLPNPSDLASELWIVVGGLVLYVMHQVGRGNGRQRERSESYVEHRAKKLRHRFRAEIVKGIPGQNDKVEAMVLAVMVYESFNRPWLARLAEYATFLPGRVRSLGVMQVQTDTLIGDSESVSRGIGRLVASWQRFRHEQYDDAIIGRVARTYNEGSTYATEILEVTNIIFTRLFPGSNARLSSHLDPR